jgi:hypothetical protein
VLLQRIRDEVAGVVEDIEATAASLRSVRPTGKQATPTEQAAVRLIRAEQHRQQMELSRLYAEFESLAFRRTSTRSALNTAA